ncbi:MAG: ferritin family protein [Candidatus Edwardsbacteria bacterium]|nr:ferritin family protein [Candidatus Edwardsbacteria bacterium]
MENKELLKNIKQAVKMENEASLFYKHVALLTKDKRAEEMLMQFSQDEEKHRRILEYVAESYKHNHEKFDFPDIGPPSEYGPLETSPLYAKKLAELTEELKPVLLTLREFIKKENIAIALYAELSDSSDDVNIRKFFDSLVKWEQRHLDLLERQAMAFESKR